MTISIDFVDSPRRSALSYYSSHVCLNGTRHKKRGLMEYENRKDLDQTARMRSLIRVFSCWHDQSIIPKDVIVKFIGSASQLKMQRLIWV